MGYNVRGMFLSVSPLFVQSKLNYINLKKWKIAGIMTWFMSTDIPNKH